jgi:hypothetical protein
MDLQLFPEQRARDANQRVHHIVATNAGPVHLAESSTICGYKHTCGHYRQSGGPKDLFNAGQPTLSSYVPWHPVTIDIYRTRQPWSRKSLCYTCSISLLCFSGCNYRQARDSPTRSVPVLIHKAPKDLTEKRLCPCAMPSVTWRATTDVGCAIRSPMRTSSFAGRTSASKRRRHLSFSVRERSFTFVMTSCT